MKLEQVVLTGDEHFEFDGMPQPVLVSDFWAWAMSRLLMDGPRGDLAEFIVRMALEENISIPKRGWGECDIVCKDGTRIEVKCSSYLQEWERSAPSRPVFSIAKTVNCDVAEVDGAYRYVGRDGSPAQRRSDIYVFCLFAHSDRETADPLKLDQWQFFVAATRKIDELLGDRKSASIPTLEKIGAARCNFYGIQREVNEIVQHIQQTLPPPPKLTLSSIHRRGVKRRTQERFSSCVLFRLTAYHCSLWRVNGRFLAQSLKVPKNQCTQLPNCCPMVFINRADVHTFIIGKHLETFLLSLLNEV